MLTLTTDNFEQEVINAEKPVFVDFYANWCGPCKMMAPVVEELSEEYADRLVFGKVDIDENMPLAQQYRVMSIPTFILYKNGEPKEAIIGGCEKSELEAKIKAVL